MQLEVTPWRAPISWQENNFFTLGDQYHKEKKVDYIWALELIS